LEKRHITGTYPWLWLWLFAFVYANYIHIHLRILLSKAGFPYLVGNVLVAIYSSTHESKNGAFLATAMTALLQPYGIGRTLLR
jgi:hypothetical protein